MVDLLRAVDVAETGAAFTTGADVDRILDRPGLDLRADNWAISHAGGLGGFTVVEALDDRRQLRGTLGVRPVVADEGAAALLMWAEHRALQVAVDRGWSAATAVARQLPGGVAEPVLRRHGWVAVRRHHHLTRGLGPTGPPAQPGGGGSIEVVTGDRAAAEVQDDTGTLRLYEDAGFRTEYQLDQWRLTTPTPRSIDVAITS